MNFAYSVFGLLLHSNLPIPELVPAEPPGSDPVVTIHMNESSPSEFLSEAKTLIYSSEYTDPTGQPALRIWKTAESQFLHLVYFDETQFWMDRKGTELWAQWPDNLTIEDTATYLLGPVLGLLLRLRGVTCLHASAISVGNRAIAFVGSEGAGKSTTAAMFAQKGCPVISDDVTAITERQGVYCVFPAYPYLSLWSDSVTIIYGSEKKLPSFSANWDKRLLSLSANNLKFEGKQLQLGALFILGERNRQPESPRVEPLTPKEALLSLVTNSYATNLLDTDMRAAEFEFLGRMLQSVPVQRLIPHQDPTQIEQLCDVVLRSFDIAAIQ
ncbi:MAG: hypothetical protein WCD49_07010 [Candidatus Acidiferrales bacterium]